MINFFVNFTNRKSQAEAFGLILIVALVFVIFAIMTRVEQGRTSSDIKSNFEVTELSSSTINTMISTYFPECSTSSSSLTFRDVLIACARDSESLCRNGHTYCNNFLQQTVELLNNFFNNMGLDYYMRISSTNLELPEIFDDSIPTQSACSENLRGEDFILPASRGNVILSLVVCRP